MLTGGVAGPAMQTAFVTDDIRRDMAAFTRALGAGPWFLREDVALNGQRYRGKPSNARISLAMAWSGPMLYEVIAPLDDTPSVFREVLISRGAGLHHLAVMATDFDQALRGYSEQGCATVHEATVAHGARIAYVQPESGALPMIEVIEALPETRAMLHRFRQAHDDWDGTDPVRAFG